MKITPEGQESVLFSEWELADSWLAKQQVPCVVEYIDSIMVVQQAIEIKTIENPNLTDLSTFLEN